MINGKCKILNSRKSGFSLVEIMISILIISITAMMFSTNIIQSFNVYQNTQNIVKASDLAQKYIEKVKSDLKFAVNYDAVSSGDSPPVPITNIYTANNYFTVTTNVNNLANKVINGADIVTLKEISVSYQKSSNKEQMVKISAIISRPEN